MNIKYTKMVMAFVLFTSAAYGVTPEQVMEAVGENEYDYLGRSVSSAGDVNGDGYDDVIAGAYGYGTGGAAYIFFGGPLMDSIYDVKLVSENANDYFGYSVSGAGDVNGDGYDDVIVGAYVFHDTASGTQPGAAYIFYGGSHMDSVYDVKMVGENTNDYFGTSVSTAGDVNKDGYGDVIVGAKGYNNSSLYDAGAAYIFYGGSFMDSVYDVKMIGENAYDYFGGSVSAAGDVNKDGYGDVVVGAYGFNGSSGAVYVFYGSRSMNALYDVKMMGEDSSDYFGYSVSGAGDVNGDGYDDVIVGAFRYDIPQVDAGAAYVFYGGFSMDSVYDVKMMGKRGYDYFGSAVATGGDINKDGYDDVVVGAYGFNSSSGAVYIFYGGFSMDTVYDVKMTGNNTNDYFGRSVSCSDDINGDGFDDVIIGAYGRNYGFNLDVGALYVYDFYLYKLLSPNGGEIWNVGAVDTIKWVGKSTANIYISLDGGQTWETFMENVRGEGDTSMVKFRVPHIPTRYARIMLSAYTYGSPRPWYTVQSDSFFTIKSNINLIKFKVESFDGGKVNLVWETDPPVSSLSGYNLYRIDAEGNEVRVNTSLVRSNEYIDKPTGSTKAYVLGAVNGLGEEYRIGELSLISYKKSLGVFPSVVNKEGNIVFFVPQLSPVVDKNTVILKITDVSGRTILEEKKSLVSGIHTMKFNTDDFKNGSYFVVLDVNGQYIRKAGFQVLK